VVAIASVRGKRQVLAEVAVLSLGGTVYCRSVRVGGDKICLNFKREDARKDVFGIAT